MSAVVTEINIFFQTFHAHIFLALVQVDGCVSSSSPSSSGGAIRVFWMTVSSPSSSSNGAWLSPLSSGGLGPCGLDVGSLTPFLLFPWKHVLQVFQFLFMLYCLIIKNGNQVLKVHELLKICLKSGEQVWYVHTSQQSGRK